VQSLEGSKHADSEGAGSEVLEGAEVRHDDDARTGRRRGRPHPADDGADRRRARPDLVLHGEGPRPRAVHGRLSLDNDRATIDRLWNPFIAAWFDGGKDDPKLALLRLDAERAEIWLDGSSIVAGIKMLFGADPKREYKDQVAEVALR